MSNKRIVVVGSSNTDMVVKSNHLPVPGETVLGGTFQMIPGGKGANQAVAAAALEGEVSLIAKVGNDLFGQDAKEGFLKKGIDITHVKVDENTPSGVALIMVDDQGENCISVALGANNELSPEDIDHSEGLIRDAAFLLIQLETPISTVDKTISLAKEHATTVVLNPAPAQNLSDEILRKIHIITPNETEAKILTGIEVNDLSSARKAAKTLKNKGIPIVIITMGSTGAYVMSDDHDELIPGIQVEAIDTTAAGDTFNGALTVALSEHMELREAIKFANAAAAISVTKLGDQTSAPTRDELLKFIESN